MRLDDPVHVREQYACEAGLAARMAREPLVARRRPFVFVAEKT